MSTHDVEAVSKLSSLDDPLRRKLYDYICEQRKPVSRDEAADMAGIGRTLAAYHLERLASAGLLDTDYQRPEGRGGPGAGRPAKLYTRADQELSVSLPARDYELLARLLVESVELDSTGTVRRAAGEVAERAGRDAAATARTALRGRPKLTALLAEALRACGYEPRFDLDGQIELHNCPFHRIAQVHPELVCDLNLRLIQGLIDELGGASCQAALDPGLGRCCVTIAAA